MIENAEASYFDPCGIPSPDEVYEDIIEPEYTTLISQRNAHENSIPIGAAIKGRGKGKDRDGVDNHHLEHPPIRRGIKMIARVGEE